MTQKHSLTSVLPEAFDEADRRHFDAGVRAFRCGDFYQAHDDWEEVWQGYRGGDRRFLQGLIHVAVSAYHAECRNPRGSRSQFGKAEAKMKDYAPRHWGVDVAALLGFAAAVSERADGTPGLDQALSQLTSAL